MIPNLNGDITVELQLLRERVARLETELAQLQSPVHQRTEPGENWVDRISGGMKDFPELIDYWRVGRQIIEENESSKTDAG